MREKIQIPVTLYRCKSVQQRTGLARSAIYQLMASGDFPKPIKLTAKAVAWPSNEIDSWILSRIEAGQQGVERQSIDAPESNNLQFAQGARKRPSHEQTLKSQTT